MTPFDQTFCLPKSNYLPLTLQHHLGETNEESFKTMKRATYIFCHGVYIRPWSIIHHSVGEHEVNVALVFKGIANYPILEPRLDSLEIHRTFNDLMVIRRFRVFNGIVKYVAISVLRNLRMKHTDNVLEPF
jgi:hypothetical protein